MMSITASGTLESTPRTILPRGANITKAFLLVPVQRGEEMEIHPLPLLATGEPGAALARCKAGDALTITGTAKLSVMAGRPLKVIVQTIGTTTDEII